MMYGNKKLQRGMGPQRCSLHISFTATYLLLVLAGGKLVKDRMTKTFFHTETLLLTAIETFWCCFQWNKFAAVTRTSSADRGELFPLY